MAQWAPRLIGLSKPGSCPIQTPFCTSATTVQPTEQWVQIDLTCLTGAPATAAAVAASAFFTMPNGIAEASAAPPAAMPEVRRKARRSTVTPVAEASVCDRVRAR